MIWLNYSITNKTTWYKYGCEETQGHLDSSMYLHQEQAQIIMYYHFGLREKAWAINQHNRVKGALEAVLCGRPLLCMMPFDSGPRDGHSKMNFYFCTTSVFKNP